MSAMNDGDVKALHLHVKLQVGKLKVPGEVEPEGLAVHRRVLTLTIKKIKGEDDAVHRGIKEAIENFVDYR